VDRSPRATTIHPAQPLSTPGSHDSLGILHTPCYACNAASSLDSIQPLLLFRPDPAGWRLDLNTGEHRHLLANHLWCNCHALPADQVSAALAQPKLHGSAILILKRAGVIAEEPGAAVAYC